MRAATRTPSPVGSDHSSTLVSLQDIAPPNVVFHLHTHPLPLYDLQRTPKSLSFLGLSKSFCCQFCNSIRYRFARCCEKCQVCFCAPCFNEQQDIQQKFIEESIARETAAAVEREKGFRAAKTDDGNSSNQAGDAQQSSSKRKKGRSGTTISHVDSNTNDALYNLHPLFRACILGETQSVREIIEKSEFSGTLDLEQTSEAPGEHKGKTLLLLAAQFGRRDITLLLLARGASCSCIDFRGMDPLMHAAYGGHVDVLDELLFAKADFERTAYCGYNALLFAANKGHAQCIQRLLSAKASLSARTPLGRTALIIAALNGHSLAVKQLLSSSEMTEKDVEATDFEGYRAADAAIAKGHAAIERMIADFLESKH